MAQVTKCDNCGGLQSTANPIKLEIQHFTLEGKGLMITVRLPHRWDRAELCANCVADIIRSRFAELCGMLAPYQPARVSGFIQAQPESETEPSLTKEERKALALLSRRLLA
jgi:hypothetical protein